MKINYWVLKLKVSTLWKIIRKNKQDNHTVERLTYIYAGKAASGLLKLFVKLKRINFEVHKIEPRESVAGPALNLHSVRDDKGRVLIMRIYRHVLDIRRRIVQRMMKKEIEFSAPGSRTHFVAYLGLKVAEKINSAVFLANFARWKYPEPGNERHVENILVISHSDWDDILVDGLKGLVNRVEVESNRIEYLAKAFIIFKALIKSIAGIGLNPTLAKSKENEMEKYSLEGSKIMTYYAMGVEKSRRSDIGFMHDGKLSPSRLVFYFRYPTMTPSAQEKEWLTANNVGCFADPGVAKADPWITSWLPSPWRKKELIRFYRQFLKTVSGARKNKRPGALWRLGTLWEMGKLLTYWKDFYISNRIGIVINSIPAKENFIANLAISEIGGISVNIERSTLFDYCTYIHNSSGHIGFVNGPYSLTQIPEPSLSLNTIQVGTLNTDNYEKIEGIERMRENSKIVIALFDELPSDSFFGDTIRDFYRAFIKLMDEDNRFTLMTKTKKPKVLESMPDIKAEIERLTSEGRCIAAGWKVTVYTVAGQADIVACVPSTAAFESVLSGTRTLLYNPMAAGCSIFYSNNGLNRRIFENSDPMLDALKRFADGKDESIGDCSDIVKKIDPFTDGKGPQRMGSYLQTCFDLFDVGASREEIITKANALYTQTWGADKLTCENEYELRK